MIASRTCVRLTLNLSAKVRSEGSLDPVSKSPAAINA